MHPFTDRMIARSQYGIVLGLIVGSSLGLSACSALWDQTDPAAYPYRLEAVSEHDEEYVPVDLDGDGRDEIVEYGSFDLPDGAAVKIRRHDGTIIEQVNFAGSLCTGNLCNKPRFLHLDDDRALEILVPFVRDDSLFVRILSDEGVKRQLILLATGEPRQEGGGTIAWDPRVTGMYLVDVDKDGQRDLVSVVVTGYARMPRGVLAHDLTDGHLIGQHLVGAAIGETRLGDFDGDGSMELAFRASAVNNGARAGGLEDSRSYFGVFDLDGTPSLQWGEPMGGNYTGVDLLTGDFAGMGRPQLFVVPIPRRAESVEARLIDPQTRGILQRRRFAEPVGGMVAFNLDQDASLEILVVLESGQLLALNSDLEVIRQRRFPWPIGRQQVVRDVNDDGEPELFLLTQDIASHPEGVLLSVNNHLDVTSFTPLAWKGYLRDVVLRGEASPHLLVQRGTRSEQFRMVAQPFYLAHRYGPWALGLLGVGLLGWASGTWVRRRRQRQVREGLLDLVLDTERAGLLLVDRDRCVEPLNAAGQAWVPAGQAALDDLHAHQPALAAFLSEATTLPARRHERDLTLQQGHHERTVHVVADPLVLPDSGVPCWLVRLDETPAHEEATRNRAWGLMAQRVAHDLKNPLTSIRLTVQRMQMEYRDHAPELAEALDPYSTRLEERIEYLRRMTHNFMKFVDLEAPSRVETDLNAFVTDCAEMLAHSLPSDIDLDLALDEGIPPVPIDREQVQSVLENLVGNAVQAMMEGGRITISTHLARGLRLGGEAAARDYVMLEVMDTGSGMPAAVKERLFEPGFTTSEEGTGLGLALVHKIVHDHEGHVVVESEPGTGSAFCVYLPVE